MSVVQSPVASPVASPVRAPTGSGGSPAPLTALAQILALDPTALWWPTEGAGWQGRTGGDLSAVGSPVGILPDLSELGGATLDEWLAAPTTPELVTNGTFDTDVSGWTVFGGATASHDSVNQRIEITNGSFGGVFQTISIGAGKVYFITGNYVAGSNPTARIVFNYGSFGGASINLDVSTGAFSFIVSSGAAQTQTRLGLTLLSSTTGVNGFFDNISVRELPGIHAIAPTDAARPLLGRAPVTGRRNLLTYTEQFDNAAGWQSAVTGTGALPVVTANAGTDPLGGTTADRLQTSRLATSDRSLRQSTVANITFTNGVSYTVSLWAKSFSGSNQDLQFVANANGALVQTVTVTSEWQRFVYSFTSGATITNSVGPLRIGLMDGSSSALSSDVLIWGAQLELGSTATAYQRVVTALDVTEAGVADTYYVNHDGVDDHFALSSSIPITEEMTVVRAFGRASASVMNCGLGNGSSATPRTSLWNGSNQNTYVALGGTTAQSSSVDTRTGAFVDVSSRNASNQTVRRNSVEIFSPAAPAVSGSLSTFGYSSIYNNGPISFLAVFDRELTGDELALVENIAAGTNGATLA